MGYGVFRQVGASLIHFQGYVFLLTVSGLQFETIRNGVLEDGLHLGRGR